MLSSSVAKITRRYWESSWGKGEWNFKHSKRTSQCSKWDSVTSTSSRKDSIRTWYRYFCVARWAANGASGTRTVAERCLRLWKRNCQSASQFSAQMSAMWGSAEGRGYSLKRCLIKRMSQTSANSSILLNLMNVSYSNHNLSVSLWTFTMSLYIYTCVFIYVYRGL